MRDLAEERLSACLVPTKWLRASATAIPLVSGSIDSVVVTYTHCSIEQTSRALAEMRRVLAPGGRLLFCEHGASPEPGVRRWQDRLNGVNRCLAGGCNINRRPDRAIRHAGFTIERLETGYLAGAPRVGGFNYLGVARA